MHLLINKDIDEVVWNKFVINHPNKSIFQSPYYYNVIKEAMACNCPIVATDVGDIKEIIGDTEGCFICSFDSIDVANKIKRAIEFAKTKGRTNGRKKILKYDNKIIAEKIYSIYQKVLLQKK